MAKMRCNKCGSPIMEGDKYCSKCGNPLTILREVNVDNTPKDEIEYPEFTHPDQALKEFAYIAAFLCFCILVFMDDSDSRRIIFILVFIVGLLFPLRRLTYMDNCASGIKTVVIAGLSSISMMLLAFFLQRGIGLEGIIGDLLYINTFPAYLWIYLIILIASLILSKHRRVVLCLSSILVGGMLPIILAGIIILIVVMIIIALDNRSSNSGFSSGGDFDSFSGGSDSFDGGNDFYDGGVE